MVVTSRKHAQREFYAVTKHALAPVVPRLVLASLESAQSKPFVMRTTWTCASIVGHVTSNANSW